MRVSETVVVTDWPRLINVRGRQDVAAVWAAAAMCRVVSDLSSAKPQPGKRNLLDGGAREPWRDR